MDTLLVTGGAGFIGSNFLTRKIKNGTNIIDFSIFAGSAATIRAGRHTNTEMFSGSGPEIWRKTVDKGATTIFMKSLLFWVMLMLT